MKKIILSIAILFSINVKSQTITNSTFSYYTDFPSVEKSIFHWAYEIDGMTFYSKVLGGIDTTNVWFDCLDINASSVNTYSRIAALSLTGDIKPMDISALPFKPSSYTVTPNVYSNGFGISKIGTEPAVTFSINQSDIMTVNRAADSIASLDTKINGKVPNSRTITINGTSQDLSVNRTWSNVGIELPSQTGNAGKVLSTTGTVTTWVNAASGTVTSVGLTSTDFTVSGSPITTSGNITANLTTTGVSTGTYDWVTVDTKGRVTAAGNPSFTTPSRALNSNFTISTTKYADVAYPIRIAYNVTALLGSTGIATLQYSTNGGSSWTSYPPVSNNINLGVVLSGYNDYVLIGKIPPNALVRIVTSSSNATVTIRTEQSEIIY